MQVSIESTGTLERRMNLTLPAGRLQTQVAERLREVARTTRIKGFRAGKVPAKVIEQRYGEQVQAEAIEGLLRETFSKAISENELLVVGSPQIEKGEGALDFVAIFEVVPDFGEMDVTKLNVIRHTAEVTDADIEHMIENLRLQRRTWSPVTRAIESGDLVALESWTQVGDERLPAEGVEKGSSVIGSGAMYAPIEKALEGLSKGEEKSLTVDFPADWRVAQLAGHQAQVHMSVVEVSEPVLPEVDKAFIKSFGVKSGELEQFHVEIRANLERELKGALMGRLRREVGEQLIANYAQVEMPTRLVEDEARSMLAQQVEQWRRNGQEVSNVPEDAYKEFIDTARKRVLVGLVVGEVARTNELRLEPKRVTETLRLIASTYEQPEQVIEMYRNDPQIMNGLRNRVMEEQVIDWIAERAQHTEQSLSFQEAIRS